MPGRGSPRARLVGPAAALLAALTLAVAAGRARSADDDPAALRGRFDTALASGAAAEAQSAGKRLLAEIPEDPLCLYVLRAYLERGWKWPRLRTSFATLRRWEQDLVDTAKEPDLRLALLDALEDLYPKEDAVRDGGTLYERAWTQLQAGRCDEAERLARDYVRRFRDGDNADKIRVVVLAPALLGKDPPDRRGARKVLEDVADDERSRYRGRALRVLDELAGGAAWIDVADGCPRPDGIGRVVLLTDLPADDALYTALGAWRDARGAEVVRFRSGKVQDAAAALRRLGPEFVAIATRAAQLDTNFHWDVVELCRDLDGDPLPDFHFGYLVARDAADLRALAERTATARPRADARLATVGVPKDAAAVAPFDAVLHYGHGLPTGLGGGLDAPDLEQGSLPRAPLVVSGACYTAAVGRSWHPCTTLPSFCRAVEIAPDQSLALAWLHAGALGVVGATEADRGEMAGAEWAYLRATACRLGELPTLDYRLAFTSLPEEWEGMPRQRAGDTRSLALYDVMLRGQLSRCLVGDPTVRLLDAPLDADPLPATVTYDDAGRVVVEVHAEPSARGGEAQFLTLNTLTRGGLRGNAFSERRLFARVELPADLAARLGVPEVSVTRGDAEIPRLRTGVRHEVWGGRRYVCVQVESADAALVAPGASARFTFPVGR